PDLAIDNLRQVLITARSHRNFVRIDMESSAYLLDTLAIYGQLRDEGFDNVGVVIQSYLYRSADDVKALIKRGANVRLVKGAYDEPANLAFPRKADVDANFIHLMKLLLGPEARAHGVHLAVATHDDNMIQATNEYAAQQGLTRADYEFQMLYGIRSSRQVELARAGHPVRVYIPYGTHWYPYFMRRLAERPANLFFVLKNVLR
ncbi:MAG TPA: proline dehydrogenase family protein, partial [Ardenticatenaceae bacterium]|nr:proline dehydrogenase family protein [Ardenticatenaceae bacterium]